MPAWMYQLEASGAMEMYPELLFERQEHLCKCQELLNERPEHTVGPSSPSSLLLSLLMHP